jgi:hypothetical protein
MATIGAIFGTAWEAIKLVVMTPVNFIKEAVIGAFNTVRDGITSAIGGISSFVSMVFNGIAGVIKAPINAIIGLVNGAINALNKISVTVPDWVPMYGGRKFGFNLSQIAYLAAGGTVLPQPGGTLAVLAEGGQPETVVDTGKMNRLLDQVTSEKPNETPQLILTLLAILKEILDAIKDGHVIVMDSGEQVGATAGLMARALEAYRELEERQVVWS